MSTPVVTPGLAVYGNDVILAALRSIGVKQSGEQCTPAESQDALFTLNQMLDAWQTQRRLVYAIQRYVYSPAALKQTYTVGPGGDVSIAYPTRISGVGVINQPGSSQPIELYCEPLNDQQWKDIPVKATYGALPQSYWYDNQFPLGNLNFWPIPNVQVSFALYPWQVLSQFADTNITLYTFPPGYLRAVRYNLAVELAMDFPADPAMVTLVSQYAAQSLALIKAINEVPLRMACDSALVNAKDAQYNWLTDMAAGR